MGSKKRAAWSKQKSEFLADLGGDGFDDIFAREDARTKQSREQKQEAQRKKACTSKNRYSCRQDAEAALFACAEHGTTGLSIYKCPYCNGWHLTSHPWSD